MVLQECKLDLLPASGTLAVCWEIYDIEGTPLALLSIGLWGPTQYLQLHQPSQPSSDEKHLS